MQLPFMTISLMKISKKGPYFNLIEAIYFKVMRNNILKEKKVDNFSSKIRHTTQISNITTYVQYTTGNQARERIKQICIRKKEIKLLFAGVMILYIEESKDSTR